MVSFQDLSAYLDFKADIKVLVFILAGTMNEGDSGEEPHVLVGSQNCCIFYINKRLLN